MTKPPTQPYLPVQPLEVEEEEVDHIELGGRSRPSTRAVPLGVIAAWCTFVVFLASLMVSQARKKQPTVTSSHPSSMEHSSILRPIDTQRPVDVASRSSQGRIVESSHEMLRFLPPNLLDDGVVGGRAIPTNYWWGNLIHKTDDSTLQSSPVFSHPYRIALVSLSPDKDAASPAGLWISYPFQYRYMSPRDNANNASRYYYHLPTIDVIMSAVEFHPGKETWPPTLRVTDWDPYGFGVTIEMRTTAVDQEGVTHSTGSMLRSYLVIGMSFVTAEYIGDIVPLVSIPHLVRVNDKARPSKSISLSGTKFILSLENGQQWVMYASSIIAFSWQENKLIAQGRFQGTLRVALLPRINVPDIYDPYWHCVVTGGELLVADSSHYSIQWKTNLLDPSKNDSKLLHFGLPHHGPSLHTTGTATPVQGVALHSTTRGLMQAYASPSFLALWEFVEQHDLDVDFMPPNPMLRPELWKRINLWSLLEKDVTATWNVPLDGSYYFNGKEVQKYASLCLLADLAAQTSADSDGALRKTCIAKLETVVAPFLTNGWTTPLVYDEVYRGIVSSAGFRSGDIWSDFGNAAYNDHHYHWGYWIVTSAIIKHLDPEWSRIDELTAMVNLLVRDGANPSPQDPWFPAFRQFSWFLGHSLSHGVSPMMDGKDEESTSEEMNFNYGLFLWGRVSGNAELEQLGQLMMKVNARAIQTYFLITRDNLVHPPEFLDNKVVGILFDNKIDYATWFSPARECIHGIQMLPVSPVMPFFRSRQFVQEEWDGVLSRLDPVVNNETNSWLSLIYSNLAQVQPERALDMLAVVELDGGLSRSWAMFVASTFSSEPT